MLCHELPDLLVLALTQPELSCCDRLFYLAGMTCADNRCSDRWIVQRPGDGNNSCRELMCLANLCQQVCQGQVARKAWLLEFRASLAPVVLGQVRNARPGHLACEQTRSHR